MQMVYYSERPEKIKYSLKPTGKADVWLRGDIAEDNTDEGIQWHAIETYLPDTSLTLEEVQENFLDLMLDADATQKRYTQAVQDWMDSIVQKRNYDSIGTACTYKDSTDPTFKAEGTACVAWRDKVWRYCYDVMNAVKRGERALPQLDELLAEVPVLEW